MMIDHPSSYILVSAFLAIISCSFLLVILCLAMQRTLRLLDVVRSMLSHNLSIVERINASISGPVSDDAKPDCARPGHFINSSVAPEEPLAGVCCADKNVHLTVIVAAHEVSDEVAR